MSRRHLSVLVGVVLVAASCGGDGSADVTTTAPASSTTSAIVSTTAALSTTSGTPTTSTPSVTTTAPTSSTSSTTTSTTSTTTVAPRTGVVVSIPVGSDGVEYRGSGNEQEITGPSLLAIDPGDGIHMFDPVGARILSFHSGTETSSIDLAALDIASVTAMAANPDHLVLVEIFFQPERNRVHRVRYDGALIQTIELPPGLRLEDGLSGVRSGPAEEIILEFAGGTFFAVWNQGSGTFVDAPAITGGDSLIVPFPPDLEIGGRLITADLTNSLGGLRYLGTANDGNHLLVREDVVALEPALIVVTTVEWYSADGSFVGSARVPSLQEHYISTPPAAAMFLDGQAVALVALQDEVRVVVLQRQADRILQPG